MNSLSVNWLGGFDLSVFKGLSCFVQQSRQQVVQLEVAREKLLLCFAVGGDVFSRGVAFQPLNSFLEPRSVYAEQLQS